MSVSTAKKEDPLTLQETLETIELPPPPIPINRTFILLVLGSIFFIFFIFFFFIIFIQYKALKKQGQHNKKPSRKRVFEKFFARKTIRKLPF